jgi:hypothetical protein
LSEFGNALKDEKGRQDILSFMWHPVSAKKTLKPRILGSDSGKG